MFNGGIRLCRLFGTEIFLHPMWFFILFMFILPPIIEGNIIGAAIMTLFLVCLYASVVGHEFAHIFAGRRFGIDTPRIVVNFFGGVAMMERIPFGLPEAIIGMMGPVFSYILGITIMLPFLLGVPHTDPVLDFLYNVGYVNLLLGLFNTLPIFPMDGGRILRGILFHFNRKIVFSTKVAMIVGFIVLPLAFATFIPLNVFCIIIMGIIVMMSWGEWKQVKALYRDDMQDANLLLPDHVEWYAIGVSLFGPDTKEVKDIRTKYSNVEFDRAADEIDAGWRAFTPEEQRRVHVATLKKFLSTSDPALLAELQAVIKELEEKK